MQNKEVVGYFPSWGIYKHEGFSIKSLPYKDLTTIVYSFIVPNIDGTIGGLDDYADEKVLKGEINWPLTTLEKKKYIPNTNLVDLAHKNNCKALFSVGGWAHSSNFPKIAANKGLRKTFIGSCLNFISEYNFDGIDIDWEFPGYKDHNGEKEDFKNFEILLIELRAALDKLDNKLVLTCTLASIKELLTPINLKAIEEVVDYFHFFTFDFASLGVTRAVHNAALFTAKDSPLEESMDSVVNLLLDLGINNNKIVVGLPFYGRAFKRKKENELKLDLFSDLFGGIDTELFSSEDGTGEYFKIHKLLHQQKAKWDKDSKVPYILEKDSFVTYENELSIEEKIKYLNTKNLKGCFIWEITGDMIINNNELKQPLLNSIIKNIK